LYFQASLLNEISKLAARVKPCQCAHKWIGASNEGPIMLPVPIFSTLDEVNGDPPTDLVSKISRHLNTVIILS